MYIREHIEGIRKFMKREGQTLAVAESVTSGHLQAALSLADGATQFFHGGITTYNLGQKVRHLHVNSIHAEACNCISEKITEEMAVNATRLFSSEWAIATTGYAAPVPELNIHERFAYYAIALNERIVFSKKIVTKKEDILEAQIDFTNMVLKDFDEWVNTSVGRNRMTLQAT